MHIAGFRIGCDAASLDVLHGAGFQADRLPDAADGAVPALLAVRDFVKGSVRIDVGLARRQDDPDRELMLAGEAGAEIELERQVAAFMRADETAVAMHLGEMVDRSETEENALGSPFRRNRETFAVKRRAARMPQIVEERLPGRRHAGDAPVAFALDLEVPGAVERQERTLSGDGVGHRGQRMVFGECHEEFPFRVREMKIGGRLPG